MKIRKATKYYLEITPSFEVEISQKPYCQPIINQAQRKIGYLIYDPYALDPRVAYGYCTESEIQAYIDGDTWNIIVDHYSLDWELIDTDSCCGYYGCDWAYKALEDTVYDPETSLEE